MNFVKIVLPGKPIAKERFRFRFLTRPEMKDLWEAGKTRSILAKFGLSFYTYDPQDEIKDHISSKIRSQWQRLPVRSPIYLKMGFYMYIPKATSKKRLQEMDDSKFLHLKKPDLSNMEKFYEDCMNRVVFFDDSQIVVKDTFKKFDLNPRVEIWIAELKAANKFEGKRTVKL